MESRDLFAAACFFFGLAMVVLKVRYGPGSGRRKKAAAPEVKIGHIIVTGLAAAEARRVLADFAKLYDLEATTFAVLAQGEALQVVWNRPITSDIALYLVNYLAYPADTALSGKQPEAVGVIAVPAGIAPDGLTPGTLAKVFVPQGDTEHDLVHALTPDGRAFRISFARMTWQPITAARAPALARQVAFTLEG